jgi:hypothetical protein
MKNDTINEYLTVELSKSRQLIALERINCGKENNCGTIVIAGPKIRSIFSCKTVRKKCHRLFDGTWRGRFWFMSSIFEKDGDTVRIFLE